MSIKKARELLKEYGNTPVPQRMDSRDIYTLANILVELAEEKAADDFRPGYSVSDGISRIIRQRDEAMKHLRAIINRNQPTLDYYAALGDAEAWLRKQK